MIINDELLSRIKSIERELLKQFIEVCEKEGLQYFLVGGTCLGAVRHKGFIPWDDDIDVALPRPDYEKFLSVAPSHLGSNVFLQTFGTDPEYVYNFAKLRDSSTTFIETMLSRLNINHGVYIDIFPLDGGGSSTESTCALFKKIKKYTRRISLCYYKADRTFSEKVKYGIKKVIYCGSSISESVKMREKLYKTYDYGSSAWVANYGGGWGEREIMPRDVFGKGVQGTFEGLNVMLPENYDEYLTRLYGDYMTPPPVEKRAAHHHFTVIDLDKPYREYTNKTNN